MSAEQHPPTDSGPAAGHAESHTNAGVRFEHTDIRFVSVLAVIVVCLVWIGIQQFLTYKLFERDLGHEREIREAGVPAVTRTAGLPSEPRLEQLDRLAGVRTPDVFIREQDKEAILHGYGPTDDKDFVHVPIEWAMTQAADQIPSRKATKTKHPHNRGLVDAGEPNSGRLFKGE